MFDVAIIGGGVVGTVLARELSKYKISVCVLEKQNDVSRGASGANSAIVHAGFDCKPGTMKAKMNVRGNQLMENLCKDLGVHFRNNGSLVVGFSEEDKETLNKLKEQGDKNGVPGLKILSKQELKEMEPNISDNAVGALYAPTGSIICPYNLCIAAMGCAMDNGASLFINFKVTKLTDQGDYFTLSSDNGSVDARYVVNSAGLYSDKVSRLYGDADIDVHPRRGEYMLLDKSAGKLVDKTLFVCPTKMGKGILVSPTVDGNLILGPTALDSGDKDDTSTTADGLERVAKGATLTVPSVPTRSVITSFTGLRSVGNTGDFIIRMSTPRILTLAGIESPGLSSAPAIAEYACKLLEESGLKLIPNENFIPGRKIYEAPKETYYHIICRCEEISEGEIISAIHTNPKAVDMDGIKKRTRSGMGRCQGGFCTPFVAEILAKETNVSMLDITKDGAGSKILFSKIKEVK